MEKRYYALCGIVIGRRGGFRGIQEVDLDHVSPLELERIKRDPLRDYNNVGFDEIEYVELFAYEVVTEETEDEVIVRTKKNPVEISAGTPDALLIDDFYKRVIV